ncbi:hypothetical protein VF14_30790 [Nostoc linckia z18]|uniref:Uncharacterized protein n=2 Tax=Nostoc linckia TaxID=92942 RepID=A0A9Q6ELJ9_NOSLI|nr:hypothetical protein VF02_14740 [Nostoc linckia z1]PHJ68488.1 hypothetical protein VF05_15430 [Nostoc linckia z3]PHJ74258.1 hypothetical protein VF03_14570 [Nostoc linckia z2]PHJ80320.1 hypothetical protein VF06_22800 [Nostoc linckia z4]PHJ87795.1 hypothetical protein VF07_18550 [Nostoc linckia z6]PHJ98073.1 hypothetical protein VF04_10475 [Nostoc linckia z7]PHK04391.1 hypothetical protein VF08_11275 [Nostoc linckia z8]PHK04545.1 hypothetical protein VF09_28280 [Nostoc linckia z9]PHK1647
MVQVTLLGLALSRAVLPVKGYFLVAIGFGTVDRYEILRPLNCVYSGQKAFAPLAIKVEKHAVAQLVEPILLIIFARKTQSKVEK